MPPWFFHNATAPLDDPSASLPAPSTPAASAIPIEKETNWIPFTPEDNARLEAAWRALYVSKTVTASAGASVGKSKKSKQQPAVSVIVGAARLYAVQFVHKPVNATEAGENNADPGSDKNNLSVLGPCVAKLSPVYWHAMHDTAHVIRATWFFTSFSHVQNGSPHQNRYSSHPITDLSIAASLERGFLEMEPWSAAYISELQAVRATGRAAENKIKINVGESYSAVFWPVQDDQASSRSQSHHRTPDYGVDAFRRLIPHHSQHDELIASYENNREGYALMIPERIIVRRFAGRSSGIGRGVTWVLGAVVRRPNGLEIRMPGRTMSGIVRRGFDYDEWKRAGGPEPQGPWNQNSINHLVLVVHGIGQKLSERVETFDFTYAINTFRVLMAKQHELGMGGGPPPAVLPINWRRTINFDYDDESDELDRHDIPLHHAFSLADITPESIPTVRNIISDVLLDIPYYLSKHRPRVLHAVAAEANRIYRLWMRNNPGFNGKVSIIAHSLGSVIATDILYRQPSVPPPLFSQNENVSDKDELLLEFAVHNLFLVGSPVGFFLLLNRTNLIPRITSTTRYSGIVNNIKTMEGESDFALRTDIGPDQVGINHGGVYGCLAVDAIYNIIHTSDPIAYRLNPCVDPEYATKLKRPVLAVPVTSGGYLSKIFSTQHHGRSELRQSNPAKKKVLNSISTATSRISVKIMRAVRPTFRAGERIEENREAMKRNPEISEDERGILEPETDIESDTDDSESTDYEFGQSRRPPLKGGYSFSREPPSSGSDGHTELETRDFKYEKIIRNRMHLLNENGQIDYFIQPTGPLENQYISILTAHSSYWESKEFANLVAVECSRPEGIQNTSSLYVAVKK